MGPTMGENGLNVETLLKQKFRAGPAPNHASVFSPVDNNNDKKQWEEHSRRRAKPVQRCGGGMNLPVARTV